jgi:outer membrane murein-binding lipoprotein Lpp
MKGRKLQSLAALLLSLVLLAGCSVTDVLEDVAQRLSEANQQDSQQIEEETEELALPGEETMAQPDDTDQAEQAVTDSDALTDQEAAEALPEETVTEETVISVDFIGLSPEECITEVDGLPQLVVDCQGARAINQDIQDTFTSVVQDEYVSYYYECHKGADRFLSLLLATHYDDDVTYYTPYNLDLATGQWVTGQELLELLGLEEETLIQTELTLLGEEFTYEYGGLAESEESFYQQQYDRTVARENAETDRLWFGADGRLNFVGRIYAMAGAESYEYPMNSGYYF